MGRIFRMSALFIFLKVYIFFKTYKVSEITAGKLPDLPRRTRPSGKDNHLFAVPAQVFQNRQEIAVTRQDNDAIKILLFLHKIESHFHIAVRLSAGGAIVLFIELYRFEIQLITKLLQLEIESDALQMATDEKQCGIVQVFAALLYEMGYMPLQLFYGNHFVLQVIVFEGMRFYAPEVEHPSNPVFLLQIFQELRIVYFPT